MRLDMKSNSADLQARMDRLVKKQLPFALSLGVNKAISKTRDDTLRTEYMKFFNMKNEAWFRQVHTIRNSTAKHVRKTGQAVVAIQRSSMKPPAGTAQGRKGRAAFSDFMDRHTKGGVKTPQGSRNIAIPIEQNVTRRKGGAKAGAVNKSFKPKTVMGTGKGFIFTSKKDGKKYLGRRRGSGVQVLYSLRKSANIKSGYDPKAAVIAGLRRHLPREFNSAMRRALATAKLR